MDANNIRDGRSSRKEHLLTLPYPSLSSQGFATPLSFEERGLGGEFPEEREGRFVCRVFTLSIASAHIVQYLIRTQSVEVAN
jgi:hypothetical protein